jgi:hypothetical protein
MPHRESLGDGDGLGVGKPGGEAAPALGVLELLPLRRELPLGRGEPLAQAREPGRGLGQRVAQLLGPGAGIGGRLREQSVEPGPERFEGAQREDSCKDGGATLWYGPDRRRVKEPRPASAPAARYL